MQTRGSSAALSVRGLSKAYGSTLAVDRLDLDVPRGSFFGLVGPNGAGKTTTLSMATGLLRPDAGTAHVLGHDVWSDTVRAKQLIGVLTGQFPTPIPPPDHADLPSVRDTCLKCHSLEEITANGGPVKLILRPRYLLDEANTRQSVAVLLRPGGLGEASGARGVHWHVAQTVTYTSGDVRAQKIDLVEFKDADGTMKQYIAGTQVSVWLCWARTGRLVAMRWSSRAVSSRMVFSMA